LLNLILSPLQSCDHERLKHYPCQVYKFTASPFIHGQDFVENRKTLILAHAIVTDSKICQTVPVDFDVIYEVDWNGKLTGFVWDSRTHIDELGLDKSARDFILNPKTIDAQGWQSFDLTHANTVAYLGKNKWYSELKDERFNPENIMMSFRNMGTIIIIEKKTGKVVWRVGPDYENPQFNNLGGPIIGQHMTHIIPDGLPGAGNVLLFDNGSGSGYGGTKGYATHARGYSRILEFNPVTLERVWEYTNDGFYSSVISGVQRLPNGNTLICEGVGSRVFEVTPAKEMVWEIKDDVVTINKPEAGQGYTLMSFSMTQTVLLDMSGTVIKTWDLNNFPAKMLPDGSIIASIIAEAAKSGGPAAGPPAGQKSSYRALRVPPEWVPGNPSGYVKWANLYR